MTDLQKAQLRASEIRQKLAELGAVGDLSDEQRSEIDTLRTEYGDVERRVQALTIADDKPLETRETPETVETRDPKLVDLEQRADVGALFGAVLEHRVSDGAMAELQQHYKLAPNQVPLSLLRDAALETRAVTPAPGDVGQNQAAILPYVFPQSVGAFLGVDMPTVGVGEAVYPVLTSELSVKTPAENAAAAETTGAFSADVLSPSRLQAAFFYSREDRARFAGMDMALRQNLSDGLAVALDKEIIAGTNGLLTGTNLANHNASAVTTYADYRSEFAYGRVDGRFAGDVSDIRVVMGAATYGHAAAQFRSNNAGDRAALEDLIDATSGVRVSAHVPSVANSKQNAIVRLGMRADMVAPVWEGVTLIPDEITKAANGQIVVTAVMLHAVKILRAAGFYKQQSQHA